MIIVEEVCGNILNTRFFGSKLKRKIKDELENYEGKAILDFSDIKSISQSFADECFGKLVIDLGKEEFKNKIDIRNISKEESKVIKYVILQRLKKDKEDYQQPVKA